MLSTFGAAYLLLDAELRSVGDGIDFCGHNIKCADLNMYTTLFSHIFDKFLKLKLI